MRLDRRRRDPVQQRLLRSVEVHRPLVAHRVPWVAILGDAAAAPDRRATAVEAARVQEPEVVPHLMRDGAGAEGADAVDKRQVWKPDIREARPAARLPGKQVDDE